MNKKILLIIILLLAVGCGKETKVDEKYEEKSMTYTVGEEKIIQEYSPAKEEYTTKEILGKTTSWGLKSKYVVGRGKDIEPGVYDIVAKGWAQFNIFIGAVEIDLDGTEMYSGAVRLGPLERDICYINERDCPYKYEGYKKVEDIYLVEGDILYTSYSPYSDQGVSIRFEVKEIEVKHPVEEEKPEIKVQPLEVKESIRKYSDREVCYINDYEVPDCAALNHYDDIKKEFN